MSTGFGIYIHTPWCRTRCPYCAFNVFVDDQADFSRWVRTLEEAWRSTSSAFEGQAHSLYFGGGTPSLAPAAAIASVIAFLPLLKGAEVTVEANPGQVSPEKLATLIEAGMTRLSVGVQTFHPVHAKRLGRGHTVSQTRALLESIHELPLESWSADLIFALPGQTREELERDLDELMSYSPPHVSLYGLTIEPGTPFAALAKKGALVLPDEVVWSDMYELVVDRLRDHGLERYEVSNFAREGHRAVHNERVWRGGHYAGLGPGAHGFLPTGERTLSEPSLDAWWTSPVPAEEMPQAHEAAADLILSTLRHVDGLPLDQLTERTGMTVAADVLETLQRYHLIVLRENHVVLSEGAFKIADGVVRRLADALIPAGTA